MGFAGTLGLQKGCGEGKLNAKCLQDLRLSGPSLGSPPTCMSTTSSTHLGAVLPAPSSGEMDC